MAEIRVPITAPGGQKASSDIRMAYQAAKQLAIATVDVSKAATTAQNVITSLTRKLESEAGAFKKAAAAAREYGAAVRNGANPYTGAGGQSSGTSRLQAESAAMMRSDLIRKNVLTSIIQANKDNGIGGTGRSGGGGIVRALASGLRGGARGIASAAGLSGGLATLAAGALVAGFGLRKLAEANQLAIEKAQRIVQAQVELEHTIREARTQAQNNARSAFEENEQVRRGMITAGITPDMAAKLNKYNDAPEALTAVGTNYTDAADRRGALEVASKLSDYGFTNGLKGGIDMLPEARVRQARGGDGEVDTDKLLRELIAEITHRGSTISQQELLAYQSRHDSAQSTDDALDRNANARGSFRGARLSMATDPGAAAAYLNDRAAFVDPLGAAMLERYRKIEDGFREMQGMADAQFKLFKVWDNLTSGKGSIQVQLIRQRAEISGAAPPMNG